MNNSAWPLPTNWSTERRRKFKKTFANRIQSFNKRAVGMDKITPRQAFFHIINSPKCYISGEQINVFDLNDYSFDHFIPVSKGGSAGINNFFVCKKEYNQMKNDLLFDDFVKRCFKILVYQLKRKIASVFH